MKLAIFVLIILPIAAQAQNLSLLQDEKGLVCKQAGAKDSHPWKLTLERRDREMQIVRDTGAKPETYRAEIFLERGVLMKHSERDEVAVFFLFENKGAVLLKGAVRAFVEEDCDEIGNAKKCKNSVGQELLWTPEKLATMPVWRYGILPNHATYFYAKDKAESAMALLDFGAKFRLISGRHLGLDCRYE